MLRYGFEQYFDQPSSSSEQDPAKRLAVEKKLFRNFFDGRVSAKKWYPLNLGICVMRPTSVDGIPFKGAQ
jgi:hypothetical protein